MPTEAQRHHADNRTTVDAPLRIEAPEVLVVRPGDTLVVRFPTNIDSETFYRADREIGRLIGHRCKYMIVTADQLAVIRGDDHADDA